MNERTAPFSNTYKQPKNAIKHPKKCTHIDTQTDPRAREKRRSEIALKIFGVPQFQRTRFRNGQIPHKLAKKGVHPSPGRARHFAPRCKARLAPERYVDAIGDASDATRSGRAIPSETFYFFLFRNRPRRGRTDVAPGRRACTQSLPSFASSRRFARRRWKVGMNDSSNPFVDVDAVRSGNTARVISWEYRAGDSSASSASMGRRRRCRRRRSVIPFPTPFSGLSRDGGWMDGDRRRYG